MADAPMKEIKLFYCYAREDKPLRDELEKHLSWLKRRYQLTNWHDREILPGEEWEQAIDKHLNTAHLIFLLISPDFMASDYCFGKEMQRALERHKAGTCRVIPILLRPTFWKDAPFSTLQLLPTDAKPVTRWPDRDEAFENIVTEISRTIKDLLILVKKEEWLEEGSILTRLKHYQEALAVYEEVIQIDPTSAAAYTGKASILFILKRYEEAMAAYQQAAHLELNSTTIPIDKIKEQALHTPLRSYLPKHFPIEERDQIPQEYLSIELDRHQIIAVNPDSFQSVQSMYDSIYNAYLSKRFRAYTYGEAWILASKSPVVGYLAVPWIWLTNKSLHRHNKNWAKVSPQVYGLSPGTHWQIRDRLPIPTFGVATNNAEIAEYAFSLSKNDIAIKKLLAFFEKDSVNTTPLETINSSDFNFLIVLTSEWLEYNEKAVII